MSRPPVQNPNVPAFPMQMMTSTNGLIDFQENRPNFMEQQYLMPAVANVAAYTTNSQMYAGMPSSTTVMQGPIVMGPPTEVYAHGKTYRLVDEGPTTATAATAAAAPVSPAPSRAVTEDEIVQQRVREFMARNGGSGGKGARTNGKMKDAFKSELSRLTKNLRKN